MFGNKTSIKVYKLEILFSGSKLKPWSEISFWSSW